MATYQRTEVNDLTHAIREKASDIQIYEATKNFDAAEQSLRTLRDLTDRLENALGNARRQAQG